jgi:cell division protein ZipA
MTALQTALLIFAVLAVIAIYLYSRRDRRALDKWNPDEAEYDPLLPPAKDRQLDIFSGTAQQFDEFGVGKPRRIEPAMLGERQAEARAEPAPSDLPQRYAPSFNIPPSSPAQAAPAAAASASEKIVSLLIAEREGTHILGSQIHQALLSQKLEFGARQIYHRLHGGTAVFSVASLLKPGILDPAQSGSFSTPGLTLFMVLPGPVKAGDAIRDMISTAEKLARTLNAEVFDSRRNPLTPTGARALQQEVEAWARAHHPG